MIAGIVAALLVAACNINPIPTPGYDAQTSAAGGPRDARGAADFVPHPGPGADAGALMDMAAPPAEDTATPAPDVPAVLDAVADTADVGADAAEVLGDSGSDDDTSWVSISCRL